MFISPHPINARIVQDSVFGPPNFLSMLQTYNPLIISSLNFPMLPSYRWSTQAHAIPSELLLISTRSPANSLTFNSSKSKEIINFNQFQSGYVRLLQPHNQFPPSIGYDNPRKQFKNTGHHPQDSPLFVLSERPKPMASLPLQSIA